MTAYREATEGSPLFTESIFRLIKLGIPRNKAIAEWKGKLGEEVRMAALHREISKLSLEARRVLLACTYMGESANVELKQVTGYDDARMTKCIAELRSLFLLNAPEFIKEVPRFKVPGNTTRLIIEIEKELVADPSSLKKTIQKLRSKGIRGKTARVGEAINQGVALLREKRFKDAIKTIEVCMKQIGPNPDLMLMLGRCNFELSIEKDDHTANTTARQYFKKAYDLGQRKSRLYEWWHQSEIKADHAGGAIEVCNLAINDNIIPISDWKIKKAYSLHKLAWKHINNGNPSEGLRELKKSVTEIKETMQQTETSKFEIDTYKNVIDRINMERIELLEQLCRSFEECEHSLEELIKIIKAGENRIIAVTTVADIFYKMILIIKNEPVIGSHHIMAARNRFQDTIYIIRQYNFPKIEEKINLENKMESTLQDFISFLTEKGIRP